MPFVNIVKIIKHKLLERHFEESLIFVSVGIVAALICSAYALLFSAIEKFSVHFFSAHSYLMFIMAPVGLVTSALLVKFFAPGSSGSGIPQVLITIERRDEKLGKLFLRKSVIIVKMLSSLIAVFIGAAIGREGPSLQVAAAVAHNIGKFSERFNIKVKMDQLLIAGAASGLAAAFNTPIGGIVYAIEELSKEHVRAFRDILLLSVVISGLTAQAISGNYLYLGFPTVMGNYSMSALALIAFTGLIAGFFGASFSKILIALVRWRTKKTMKFQIFILILIGLLFATVFYFLGDLNLYSGKESINHVLFSKTDIPFYELISRIFMPIISSMTGIAGGIFAPSLSAGSVLGGVIAQFTDPGLRNILALSGMVGFLTGVTHTPITSFILVLEMTDRHLAVFPMMVAAVFSSIGSHFLSEHSFYEETVMDIKKQSDTITK